MTEAFACTISEATPQSTKSISKTFTSKKLAIQFAESINSNREFFEAYGYQNNVKIKLSELIIEYLNLDYKGKDQVEHSRKLRVWLNSLSNIRCTRSIVRANRISSAASVALPVIPSSYPRNAFGTLSAAIILFLTYSKIVTSIETRVKWFMRYFDNIQITNRNCRSLWHKFVLIIRS